MGRDHSCVITAAGLLLASGCNDSYQLGLTTIRSCVEEFVSVDCDGQLLKQVECDDRYTLALARNGNVYHTGCIEYTPYLNLRQAYAKGFLQLPISNVKSIAAGKAYGFAID